MPPIRAMKSGTERISAVRSARPIGRMEIVVAVVLMLAALLLVLLPGGGAGDRAVVRVKGEVVRVLPLDRDSRVDIVTEWGTNTVVVEDGKVFVERADCPSQTCVRTAAASRVGQRIVCAPHFLTVTVEGESDLDAIV